MKNFKTTLKAFFVLVVISATIISCGKTGEMTTTDVIQPDKIISVKQAKEMYDTYTKRRLPAITESEINSGGIKEFNPTRYVEYSIEELKNYIHYVENETDKANAKVGNVRIYFSSYPESGVFEDGRKAKYDRRSTVFMLPTTKDENGEQNGFYTTGSKDGTARHVVFFKDVRGDLKTINGKRGLVESKGGMFSTAMFVNDSIPDDRSLIFNEGNAVPPPHQKTDFDK